MPSTSTGRIVKSQRSKKLTPHHKNHRWESFSNKILKLHSLDPLRKVRRHDLEAEDLSTTTSYLRNGLQKWAELNITRPFAAFRRQITPLTESLPQILHFEDRIMALLAEYIGRQEKEALEPLLDLLVAFAHDLGARFEKHYATALRLVVDLAGKPQDVEVIEWTFAALAFLFKYLSRLLVPDLRPTYDVVAPLLGKARVPGHIARFAAEAMSFLVKKAAAPGHREKALPLIVEHARSDLVGMVDTKQFEIYSQGIMTMFAEAIKGVGNGLHSTGPETFIALVRGIPDEELEPGKQSVWTDVCCGVLTSIIHHSFSETFTPVETAIVEEAVAAAGNPKDSANPGRMIVFARLLGTMAGVRKGSRIQDWASLVKAHCKVLGTFSASCEKVETFPAPEIWDHVLVNTAIVWKDAPTDALIPSISTLTAALTKEPLMRWFIPFCAYFADLDSGRFRSLFQKYFQKFVVAHWSEGVNEEMLCVLLPHMAENGALPGPKEKETCLLPQSWQDQIVSKFIRLEDSPFPERGVYGQDPETWRDKCLPKYSALLTVAESTTVHPSTHARIAEVLLKKLKLAMRPSSSIPTDEANFIVGDGFHAYLWMSKAASSLDASLQPLLRAAASRFCRSVGFLESLLEYEKQIPKESQDSEGSGRSESPHGEEDPLVKALISNLSAASHELRLVSLKILDILETTPDQQSALETMLQIEQTAFDLHNSRMIAVHLRKLGQIYSHITEKSWLLQAVPSYMFGMLTVPLSPAWDAAVEAMIKVSETKTGGEEITNIAFEWLDTPSPRWAGSARPIESAWQALTDFECLNLMRLRKTAENTSRILDDPSQAMSQTFEQSHQAVQTRLDNARSKALKVLSSLPDLAEKRSRRLVPYLLSWDDGRETTENPADEVDDEQGESPESNWSLFDKKAILGVFAQFQNPKVLYQSQKVYDTLLQLMANGDIEVQKLALKGILTWKQDGIKPYRENLEYLLDEARFRNELTVLFQGDHPILPEHRPEVMPILLRLLYGRSISKKGVASGKHGLHATRLAVIRQLEVADMVTFLDIALGSLRDVRVVDSSGLRESVFTAEVVSVRKQVGLLNMLESVINELGTGVLPFMEKLVDPVLYCLIWACRQLLLDSAGDVEEAAATDAASNTSLYKVARSTALKCLCRLFQNAQSFDWTPYQSAIVGEVVTPRIEKLPIETTQGISATLRLLATWAALPKVALFLAVDARTLPKVVECIGVEKAKDEVKIFVLDIVRSLVKLSQAPAAESEYNELIRAELLAPNIELVLSEIGRLLRERHDIGRDLLGAAVDTIVEVAPIVEESSHIQDIVEISTYLLNQPSRRVSPKIKGSILLILKQFIVLGDLQANLDLKNNVYHTLASLFGYFKDRQNRQTLAEVLLVFAAQEPSMQEVAGLCVELNSYAEDRLEEPDYNRRVSGFNAIARERETPFTLDQWLPLLQNFVFYICQDEEFGVLSTNSADGICKFIEAVESEWSGAKQSAYAETLATVVLPAIYSGAREPSDMARREHLRVLGFLVSHLPTWSPVADLVSLVPKSAEDTENAFFFHILSPAVSRQLQSLQLLERANDSAELSSKNISQFFIPLLEHFIFDRPEGTDDRGLGARATDTIASLAASLEWQQYRAILRRFISFVESKADMLKHVIRLLEKMVDALGTAISSTKPAVGDTGAMDMDDEANSAVPKTRRRLAATLPDEEKLSAELTTNFLPTLLKHLHEKDETTVSARVPVGVIVTKLLKVVPSKHLADTLPGVLTDICHILRSKAWESREMARETLAKIAVILGPESFGFILKELRGALVNGFQLHVLSYTLHSILLVAIPAFKQGELDYCLSSIMTVIMDDIFGVVGQEKDAEEYVSKMKEVKSSKSQDSMELVAKNASISNLRDLVQPLQALLLEKLDLRTVRKIDELLNRITAGLLQNPAAESRDTLVFCYEVIQEVYNRKKAETEPKIDPRLKKYLVQKMAKRGSERGATSSHSYKLIRFAIDILRSVLRKHDSLRTAANIGGFLPILGDAVMSGDEEVRIAAFKILTVLVRVPFTTKDWADIYKVAARDATKTISMSSSTGSDMVQSALKLVSVILRDRPEVEIKDAAIDALLGQLKDDLTEPLYRHVTFNFVRSVLDRRIETAVVYDTLDYVGTVAITNDDKDTRDLARGAFFQFIREYPQKRNRWAKQLAFIVANLKYEREGGRLSVMEVIHLLLRKTADDYVQEVAATCFIPLVFVVANDDSEKCRLAAGQLVREVFRAADRERMQKFLTLLRSWVGGNQDEEQNPAVLRLALQTFGFYFDARDYDADDNDGNAKKNKEKEKDRKDLNLVVRRITDVLGDSALCDADTELAATALAVVPTLLAKHPERVLSPAAGQALFSHVKDRLAHPDAAVQLAAIKLVRMYLADFVAASSSTDTDAKSKSSGGGGAVVTGLPFVGSHGLRLEKEDAHGLVRHALGILKTQELEEPLAEEVVQVLTFLGAHLDSTDGGSNNSNEGDGDDDDEEEEEAGASADGDDVEEVADETEEAEHKTVTDLKFLFHRLTEVIRRETRVRPEALVSKVAAMDVLEALCACTPKQSLLPSIRTILAPLRNLTDPAIPAPFSHNEVFKARYEALKAKAQAVMDRLQRTLGTADYTRHLVAVGEGVRGRRERRSGKRRIEAVTQVEKYGRDKRKKFEKKKERRKVRGRENRDLRRGYL